MIRFVNTFFDIDHSGEADFILTADTIDDGKQRSVIIYYSRDEIADIVSAFAQLQYGMPGTMPDDGH